MKTRNGQARGGAGGAGGFLAPARWALPLLPGFVVLAGFFLIPMFELVRMSVLEYDRVRVYTSTLTWQNYEKFFSDPFFLEMIVTSLKVGCSATVGAVVLAYPMAYYLTTVRGWERTLLSGACLLPIFVTLLVGTLGWYIILLPHGVLQRILLALGLVDGPLRLLQTFPALVAVIVHLEMPYAILILASSLQNVGQDKVNAARLLGASTTQVFRRIIIPLTMPAIVSSTILIFALSISSYLVPVLITGQRIRVLPMAIFTYTTDLLNWPLASTMAVVLLVIVLAATYGLTATVNRLTGRGKWEVV